MYVCPRARQCVKNSCGHKHHHRAAISCIGFRCKVAGDDIVDCIRVSVKK